MHSEETDMKTKKICYGLCERCVWKYNGGCSEWNGFSEGGK